MCYFLNETQIVLLLPLYKALKSKLFFGLIFPLPLNHQQEEAGQPKAVCPSSLPEMACETVI